MEQFASASRLPFGDGVGPHLQDLQCLRGIRDGAEVGKGEAAGRARELVTHHANLLQGRMA